MKIGQIKRVPLNSVWKHEALDFTTWLQDNLDIVNAATGLSITTAEKEQAAGPFRADLVAQDASDHYIIIENQYGKTNHDHLGKLITYVSAFGAKAGVWIAEEPRPEHVHAVTWLNETQLGDFYILKAEAIVIETEQGQSAPAPLLTLIVGPSAETKAIGATKDRISDVKLVLREFWTQLLEHAKSHSRLHANLNPTTSNWVATSIGKSYLMLTYVVGASNSRVELYIDKPQNPSVNAAAYDHFLNYKEQIESTFGNALEWQELEGKNACRICYRMESGGYKSPPETWKEIIHEMVHAMVRFASALQPFVKNCP